MGLFGSGSLAAGGTYAFAFAEAGSYPVIDPGTGHTGSVAVPVTLTPATGTTGTHFAVRWASAAPPSGYLADVQILRPATSVWADWQPGTAATSASFTPDAGLGTYRFRARLRNTANGHTSGWSSTASISVT